MTHHDGTESHHVDDSDGVAATAVGGEGPAAASPAPDANADRIVDEAADFVHPVDHGAGTRTEPLESEEAGGYVSVHDADAPNDPAASEEKGDYVQPVDHGGGSDEPIEDAGDYVSPTSQ
ncbi:MAG: hypothetical protein JWL94_349 [Microbacteriaceae bacterium]|jgi:hypothetical protein|nr:hypothetical protein [Microbacteriaceae bacterium]HEV7957810.1 hypothetical protein [Marisediminicola sp.]